MGHLMLLKVGYSVLSMLCSHSGAKPGELAMNVIKDLAGVKIGKSHVAEDHCDVCHAANLKHLAEAA